MGDDEEDILLADGFDDAVIGVGYRCGQPDLAVYDIDKCISILMKNNNWDRHEAIEYFEFNVIGAWVGENTPMWVQVED